MANFHTDAWCVGLGNALDGLVSTAWIRPNSWFPGALRFVGTISNEEAAYFDYHNFLTIVRGAQDGFEGMRSLSRAWVEFDESKVARAWAIIRSHPVIRAAIDGSGDNPDPHLYLFKPFGGASMLEPETLVHQMAKLAFASSGEDVAWLLDRFLVEGSEHHLVGYEITLIMGLSVGQRIEIAEGMHLEPYPSAAAKYGPHPHFLRDTTTNPIPLWMGTREHRVLTEDSEFVTALVRKFKWGPSVGTLESKGSAGSPVVRLPSVEGELLFPPKEEVDRVGTFLTLVSGHYHAMSTTYTLTEPWLNSLDLNYGYGNNRIDANLSDCWSTNRLTDEDTERFEELLQQRRSFRGDGDRLDFACHRIAALYTRTGKFRVADRVIDIAIALEVMYEASEPGIAGKLRNRAASLLASNTTKPEDISKKMRRFYRARSAITHGGRLVTNEHDDKTEEALRDGLDMARQTAFALLKRGETPNWA